MWLEESLGRRIKQLRFEQLSATGTTEVAVACPYCFSMHSDAQRESDLEQAQTLDVIELVAMSLDA